jgi:hypothetical protein
MSDENQRTDWWCVSLGSERVLQVRGFLTKAQSFDDLIEAIQALSDMLPEPSAPEVDVEWAE